MSQPKQVALTEVQKGDLARLWPNHAPDERDSNGDTSTLCPPRPGLLNKTGGGGGMDDITYNFIARLHSFLLHTICDSYHPNQRRRGEGGSVGRLSSNDGETRRREDEESEKYSSKTEQSETFETLKYLFHPRPYNKTKGGNNNSNRTAHNGADFPIPKLLEGRHVLYFNHSLFTSEFDTYETTKVDAQQQGPSQEYVRNHSYGAFLHHRPEHALPSLSCAIGLVIVTLWRRSRPVFQQSIQEQTSDQTILYRSMSSTTYVIRFENVDPLIRMIEIKTSSAYKFVSVRGHITKAKPKRLRVACADFQCGKCGEQFPYKFIDGRYNVPTKCEGMHCRSKTFVLVRSTASYIDYQELKLQESQEETTVDAGRTPRVLEVECMDDLVDTCHAGDVVKIAGVIRAVNSAVAAGRAGKRALETSTYTLYLVANSISNATAGDGVNKADDEDDRGDGSGVDGRRGSGAKRKRKGEGGGGGRRGNRSSGASSVSFGREQLERITQLAHADHKMYSMRVRMAFPFDLLVRSLCPSIIGHDLVKAGLLLGLLGGTPPLTSGLEARSGSASIRSNSHILIVGDPGMGKSQMLLAASHIAERSVYVGGNTASTTGLTVSLTKEAGGEVGIEAGALVLADQGVCCIDEFDKMAKSNQDGLLEAMEQQQISIAKAGVVASLPARCSVIAAANPKNGNYNMGKTVAENLAMATPLLSRFDLVFILRDRADLDQDRMISSNIMDLYRQRDGTRTVTDQCGSVEALSAAMEEDGEGGRVSLSNRLRWVAGFQREPLPADLVRDYISYAREYCRPKMTQEAATVLKDYFMNLRYPPDGTNRGDCVPITTRQLEALIRLSQARAKACLRDFVLKEDAEDVKELMMESVNQVHMDEQGVVDRTRGGAGGKSKRKAKQLFMEQLRHYAKGGQFSELTLDHLRIVANQVKLDVSDFKSFIEELRGNGELMKTSAGAYIICS
mmetsp:Transcript_7799/g.11626  ORF Transcript_7799/g.11626 Transcript_7799/m.11626 type:complete len:960 (-) Transcript_7799:245-3124(-)